MKRKKEIAINYRLHKVAGKWRVYDVVVKGVSLINTYRQQFRSIIKRTSYDELVKILRRKKNEG
jgi:phospholipid transport system substrate-binding protein